MIDVKLDRNKVMKFECEGTAHDLAVEVVSVIHSLYLNIREKNLIGAIEFRDCIENAISENIIFVDSETLAKRINDKFVEMLGNVSDEDDEELGSMLKEIFMNNEEEEVENE